MSENKLTKKYIGSNQVGSVQVELENNSSLRAKDSEGVSQELLKLNTTDELVVQRALFLSGDAASNLQAVPKQQLDSAVSGIQTDISEIEGRVDTLESEMDTAQADIISLDGRVDTLETEMDQAQADILALDGRTDTLETKVSNLESEMDTAQAEILALDGRLDVIEPKVSILETEMDQAQADIISLDNRVDTLESEMDEAQSDISALEAEDLTFVKLDGSRAMTGDLSMMPELGVHYSIKGLADPVDARDAVNKQYVDSIAEGLHVHAPAKSIINQSLAEASGGSVVYNNGTDGVGATLTLSVALTSFDDYTFQEGDRVIVNGETNKAHNGIYTVGSNGSLGTVFTRSLDYNTPAEMAGGDFVFVQDGTQYADSGWVQIDTVTTVGTSPVQFVQFSGAGAYTAGDALSLIGNEFNVKYDNSTISLNGSNELRVDPAVMSQISTLESEMDQAQADIISLDGRLDVIEPKVSTLETEMDQAQADILSLDGRMDTVEGKVSTLESEMATAQAELISLDGRIDVLEPKVATLESEMDTAQADIISLDGRMDTVEGKVSTLESEMDTAQADIISLDGRIDVLEPKVSTLESEMDAAQAELISLDGRVDALEESSAALQSDVNILIPQMSQAQADIISLDGRMDTVEGKVSTLESEMDAAQAEIISLDGRVDVLEPKVATLESEMDTAQADIISLDGRVDVLEPKVATLESEMDAAQAELISLDGRLDILEPKVSTLESEMDAVQADVIVLEERSEISYASAYNSFASVYADGQPGQLDPTSTTNPRHGWYYKNSVAGQKINWYFFDGLNQANISLGAFSAYAVMTFDAVLSPIMAVYTVPTGSGDIIPGFAHSRVVYNGFDGASPAVGQKCIVYFGEAPVAHPELPRFKLLQSALPGGDQNPAEQVLTSSFGSNSAAVVNTVQYMVESLGVESANWRGEVELEIRPAFRQLDGSVDMLSAKISNLADPSLAQDAATKAYVDSRIAAGTDYEVHKVVLSATDITNQYIDLPFKASLGSVIASSARVNLIVVLGADSDADFQQDNSGAVTRLSFQGPSASLGESPLEADQIIYFNYVKA